MRVPRSAPLRGSVGIADGLGLVMVLTLLGYVASFRDPINLPRMAWLWIGAAGLTPFVIRRWRHLPRGRAIAVPAGAAVALVGWGVVSILVSGNPLGVGLYGWWGRSDGLLTLTGVAVLLLAAATLDGAGLRRLEAWLLVGFAGIGLVGIAQGAGLTWSQGGIDALLGNPNIAAGLCSVGAVLLAFAALQGSSPTWLRATRAGVALVLVVVALLTRSAQGPATVALGGLVGLAYLGLASQGRRRRLLLVVSGAGVAVATLLVVTAIAGLGPLASLWSEVNTQIRIAAWSAGVETLLQHPVAGVGPGGMERYYFEYVSDDYIGLVGPQVPVNALHNIALQHGATLGVPGLLLWLVVFTGAAVLLGRAAWLGRVPAPLAAAVGGSLAAYVVQGMVSIDMVALMALGWLVAGMSLSLVRAEPPLPPGAARPAMAAGYTVASALAMVAALLVLMPQVRAIPPGGAELTADSAVEILANPLTPCHIRVDIAAQVATALPADVGPPAVYDAWRIDRRCLTMAHLAAQTAMAQGDLVTADEASAAAVAQDPTFVTSWTLRARYHALAGDLDSARADLARAREAQALYPDPGAYEAGIAELEQAIAGLG